MELPSWDAPCRDRPPGGGRSCDENTTAPHTVQERRNDDSWIRKFTRTSDASKSPLGTLMVLLLMRLPVNWKVSNVFLLPTPRLRSQQVRGVTYPSTPPPFPEIPGNSSPGTQMLWKSRHWCHWVIR